MTASRSARASTARFATVLALSAALLVTGAAAGAAGATMIIGSEINNAGSANTQLLTHSNVVAFKLLQNGPGTALMGYTTPLTGATRGVYGRVDSPNGDGVQARNAAAGAGTGSAIHAFGQANIGIIAESDDSVPLKLTAPSGIAPFSTNSSTKVANLNADELDGLNSDQFARADVVATGHANCMGRALQPETSTTAYDWTDEKVFLTAGTGALICSVSVPDGSTITALRCSINDAIAEPQADCFLVRALLVGGGYSLMADTADYEGTPLAITLEDVTITNALVDNGTYSYLAIVYLGAASLALSVSSISVEYTVSGLPVD